MSRRAPTGPPAGSNLLELVPVRTASWSEDAGRVVVEVPIPSPPWYLAWLPARKRQARLRLDEVGSLAWNQLDGRRTVGDVAAVLREQFGERVEPVDERLGILLSSMHRGRLIAYLGYDEIAEPSEPR